MPRKSPYVIRLTKRERAELMARTREYTSPYRDVVRAKIVLLASHGFGNDRIASGSNGEWHPQFPNNSLTKADRG
jgi:hypothetical protein